MNPPRLPPCMQVFERGWLSSNNILFTCDDAAVLVDSGYVTHADQTLALVRHALGGRKLDLLINTHLHSDHCGGNAALQAAYACPAWVPAVELDAVQSWDMERLSFRATGQQCARFDAVRGLVPGESLQLGGLAWQVLAAPGHDPHALMLYCAGEGILISADALWENGFGVIFPELEGASGFAEQAAVLDLIAGLDLRLVIPGHGAPFADVRGALARARSRLDYLAGAPGRNARNALKVMMAFLLLEARQLELPQLAALVESSRLMRSAAHQTGTAPAALIAELAGELAQAGMARLEGQRLFSL